MRLRTFLIVLVLAGAGLLAGVVLQRQFAPEPVARAVAVPQGDREIAWFHTSTNAASWERFVAGIHRAKRLTSGLEVDDSRAFPDKTTAIPEVVIAWRDRPGKLRVRWYKVSSETSAKQWIDALAERDPPPLAIIGGGSSDRARDLARDLEDRTQWRGPRPLLFITTATANEVWLEGERISRPLTQVYPGRSFRFCFTNEQMARAVIDFVWAMPDLSPFGGPKNTRGVVFPVQWEDDPYSVDLCEKFRSAVTAKRGGRLDQPFISHPPYSVGAFARVNRVEAEFAHYIVTELPTLPAQRSLLILPTSTTPARRFLRALTGESPLIGRHLVTVNGDAISINDVYRDGALLWNVRDVAVPLVFFAHQNPIDWGDDLPPPTGTDEVLLMADLVRVLATAVYPADGELARNADALLANVRAQQLIVFDADGNRREGEEYVVCLRPEIGEAGRVNARASLEVWHRLQFGAWEKVKPPLPAPYPTRTARRLAANGP